MRNYLLFSLILLIISCSRSDNENNNSRITLEEIQKSSSLLPEISGLAYKNNNTLYAHNDGGNSPSIYQIPLDAIDPIGISHVNEETNFDWEDLTEDEEHLYIGEFGNNYGDREDLRILKVKKSDLNETFIDAESIYFSYKDQNSTESGSNHNFDCEAMIHYKEEIFLFTKNRENLKTHLYRVPNIPGEYVLEKLDEFNTEGLITAADINITESILVLLGYNFKPGGGFESFIWIFYDFTGNDYFGGKQKRLELSIDDQFEALCFSATYELILSAESEQSLSNPILYKINIEDFIN